MAKQSTGERIFEARWGAYGMIKDIDMPELVIEHRFNPARKWRFDFAHIESKTAIEIDGGVWSKRKSGHTSGKGYTRDRTKENVAKVMGWSVLRYTPQMIEDDPLGCIEQILQIIRARS